MRGSIVIDNRKLLSSWLLAIRLRTLPACVGPILVGNALAYVERPFSWLTLVVTLLCALFLQISVNLANDYFDFIDGVDTQERLGPVRVTQSGLLSPGAVRNGVMGFLLAATLSGLYLVWLGGWPLLLLGALSILAVLGYSGGPFPLASHGLGEATVFIFFGLVAVAGTYYVQCQQLGLMIVLLAVAVGLPVTAILVVNNLRDIATDARAGKNTLAVLLGEKHTRLEFGILLITPFLILFGTQTFSSVATGPLLLPLLSMPVALTLIKRIYSTTGSALNPLLADTARFSLLFCVLLSAGIMIGDLPSIKAFD